MNSIQVLELYRKASCWVFDAPEHGLVAEAFVGGMSELIDAIGLMNNVNMKDARSEGARVMFSHENFFGSTRFDWIRGESGGNVYYCPDALDWGRRVGADWVPENGWLCPQLLKYFPEPPPKIYARVENIIDSLN